VAKNKLIGKAAFWLDTERRGGSETDLWETIHPNPNTDPVIPFTRIGLKDGLITIFKVDISQLEAGLPLKYREFAMSGENPPTDPTTLRKRCAQLEAMQSCTKRIAALSAEVNEENPKAIEESPIELLTKEIAALKAEIFFHGMNE
jgi:hypothetical protein